MRGPDQQLEPPFCLAGTDELVSNVTEAESTTVTRQTHEQLYAKYDLWAVAPGKLEGKAALSYAFKGTITDTEATGCKVQTAIVDNFSWNVQLVGQYVDQPDGSVLVSFQATPAQGPSYREHFEDCPIPKRTLPGVTWSGVTVTIVGDVYDVDRNLPLPANSTGSIVDSIYIQRGSE